MFRESQIIGLYTLIKRIGRGGFGEVWLAERRAKFVTTKVAVKLPLEEQIDHEAIKHEAVLWEQASGHPNVLPIIDADEYDGQIVIVSEYAPDGSLEEFLKKTHALSVRTAVELTMGILSGLEFLHNKKIIHRDIKPANILLQGDTPRLADFGISRVMKTTSVSVNMSGTPSYMAPEAFDRKRNEQTDIWSVGVILYQMLKGSLPFPQENMTDLLGAVIMGVPEPLPEPLPPRLREIVFKALAKKSEERYSQTREMRDDLADFLISISQQRTQATIKFENESKKAEKIEEESKTAEEKTAVFSTNPLVETKASPTIQRHFAADTAGHRLADTQISNEILEIPKIESPKRKTNKTLLKILAPAGLLLFAAIIGGGYFLFNKTANQDAQKTAAATEEIKLIPYRKGDKFGFVDVNKKMVIEAKYDMVSPFAEGLAMVRVGGQKQKGAYDSEFIQGGKYGFIDSTGKEIVPPKYDSAESFSDGLAAVNNGIQKDQNGRTTSPGKTGFIDKTGREVIPLKYDSTFGFKDGVARVTVDTYKDGKQNPEGKAGLIDKNGKEVVPLIYDDWTPFYFPDGEDLSSVRLGNKFGFIDKNGRVVIPIIYDDADSFSNGLAPVCTGIKRMKTVGEFWVEENVSRDNAKCGFIDKTGKEIIPLKYKYALSFYQGLAAVEQNGKTGFIDPSGNTVIPFKYDGGGAFTEVSGGGLAKVMLKGKYGIIDTKGNELTPFKYDIVIGYIDGISQACALDKNSQKLKCGFIDSKGQEITPVKYDNVGAYLFGGLAMVNVGYQADKNYKTISGGKWGFIDRTGKEVIPPKYDSVGTFTDGKGEIGYTLVTLDGKDFYIGKDGTEYYEP